MPGFVRTLTGDVPPEDLGQTLIHEHLTVDWGEMLGRPKVAFDRAEVVARMVDRMSDLAAVGFGTFTECTPYGAGRYVDLFLEVATRGPVRVIGSTGFFHESWCPMHPIARALDQDALTDLMVREITEGMGGTMIRAGLIKVATGLDPHQRPGAQGHPRRGRRATCHGLPGAGAHHGLHGHGGARRVRG